MKLRIVKPNFSVIAILSYLSVLFVFSSIISVIHKNDNTVFNRSEIVTYAKQFLINEELKIEGRELDCSGYTQLVYKHFNIKLPRSSSMQFESLPNKNGGPEAGDLVFFSSSNRKIGHVGIFIGNNLFIHSPGKQKYVRIDSLSDKYWKNSYVGCRSVFKQIEEQ